MDYPYCATNRTKPSFVQCKAQCPITDREFVAHCRLDKGHEGRHHFEFSFSDDELGIETTEAKAIRLLRGAFEWVPRAAEVAPEVEAFLEEVSS